MRPGPIVSKRLVLIRVPLILPPETLKWKADNTEPTKLKTMLPRLNAVNATGTIEYQPHFINQPADVQVLWGYALFPDRVGDFVPKPMTKCNGAEILQELCGHLRFDLDTMESANCISCRMPYITSMFIPRLRTDRPLPIPRSSKNLALISQFVEIPDDVVFAVEYSVRAAQMAVYEFLSIDRQIPPISAHDKSLRVQFEALIKAFK
jgi:oleate hydratase